MLVNRRIQIERTKNLMDKIVYFSSLIDIMIAILVSLSYFKIGYPEIFLPSTEIILTITVALTVVLGVLLIYLKHYETIFVGFLMVGNHVKVNLTKFQKFMMLLSAVRPPRFKYAYKQANRN